MRLPGPLPSLGSIALLVVLVVVLVTGGGGDGAGDDSPDSGGGPGESVTARVDRVVDGDTIEVLLDGAEEDVRYIGVDTPESVKPGTPVECYGMAASHFNERLVGGRTVRLVFDAERRDSYGRLLAYVYLGDRFVNAELVRRGYATTLTIAPNDSHATLFDRLAQEAGRAGRGLWGACGS
ncbi:MAG: thermonuclease [Solirubrobacterales bacterium]|nr:thermonuclease [Solirubrobacterales bacterium]